MNSPSTCIRRDKDLVTREIAGETIIVPIRGHVGDLDSIYTLNQVGTFIWHHLESGSSLRRLVNAVAAEYDVDSGEAEKDVADFLGSLEAAGLIEQRQA